MQTGLPTTPGTYWARIASLSELDAAGRFDDKPFDHFLVVLGEAPYLRAHVWDAAEPLRSHRVNELQEDHRLVIGPKVQPPPPNPTI